MDLRLEASGSGLARTGEDPLEEPAAETLRLITFQALVELEEKKTDLWSPPSSASG